MNESQIKKTALFQEHLKLNAKIVNFFGWQMPVQYTSVLKEHFSVRNYCGVFDVSHMGEIFVRGADAVNFLQYLTINDVARLAVGQSQYTAMLNANGGFVDDLFLYKIAENEFLACVNASNTQKDFDWIYEHSKGFNVQVVNESESWSQLAVQGPFSPRAVSSLLNLADLDKFKSLNFTELMVTTIFNRKCILARTGYTGEVGYEIFIPNEIVCEVWSKILNTTAKTQVVPCGLGARDLLRLESCYLLYGNDMNDEVTPLEAGISWAIAFDTKDFIGKKALLKQKEQGINRKLVAFEMQDKAIARHGMEILYNGKKIGVVTSGSFLPVINKGGGLALVEDIYSKIGMEFEIDVRSKRQKAVVVKKPFYKAKVKDAICI